MNYAMLSCIVASFIWHTLTSFMGNTVHAIRLSGWRPHTVFHEGIATWNWWLFSLDSQKVIKSYNKEKIIYDLALLHVCIPLCIDIW